jgi:hypothetical protein
MKLAYLSAYLMDKSPDKVLPSYLRLYPAEQACKNIAQNRLVVQLGNKTLSCWITFYINCCLCLDQGALAQLLETIDS